MKGRRLVAVSLASSAVLVLSGCAEALPPGTGTNRSLTVTVARSLPAPPAPFGGHIDSQTHAGADLTVTGWAEISDTDAASVTVVTSSAVTIVSAYRVVRPDVTAATNDRRLVWSGISITLRGTSAPTPTTVCLTSSDPVLGSHIVGGSPIVSCVQ